MATPRGLMNLPQTPSKIGPVSMDRNKAQIAPPSVSQGDQRTSFFTVVTKADGKTQTLYKADRPWAKVKLLLEDAGPVAIGDQSNLSPIGSNGILLQTNVLREFVIAKGTVLFMISTTVNRVNVVIEPLPWLEQITAQAARLVSIMAVVANALVKQ